MKIALISTNERIVEYGLRTISAWLKNNGHKTTMIFMPNSNRYNIKKYSEEVLNELYEIAKDHEIICLTCVSACSERTIQTIDFLKNKTNAFFIWGGIHATLMPEECIKYVDAVGIGECEDALLELANMIKNKENYLNTENFWFNNKGTITKNEVRPLIQDLDKLSFPDYELETQYVLQKEKLVQAKEFFSKNFWQLYNKKILVLTTRGCPHGCTYCSNNYLNKMYEGKGNIIRKRSVKSIIEELKYMKNKFPEANGIRFDDDVFFFRSLNDIKEFASEYKKEINMPFECNSTPNLIDEEKIKALVEAGLNCIVIGVQTGSDRVNKEIYKRPFTASQVIEASKILYKFRKNLKTTEYQFIVSNPYETSEDLIKTIKLIQNMSLNSELGVFNLIHFPKTELTEMVKRDGLFRDFEKKLVTEYYDDFSHIKMEKIEKYFNNMIRCMGGSLTKNKTGSIFRFTIPILIKLHGSKLEKIGSSYFYSIILFKAIRGRLYFRLMPLFPKKLRTVIFSFVMRKEYKKKKEKIST